MNVVLEGPDGAGKSYLAEAIARATGMRVQQGSGPPKQPGEIERRMVDYSFMEDAVFDRHPAVSQPIYARIRGEDMSPEFWRLVDGFYRARPVVVYCRSESPARHVVKPGENPAHVAAVHERYPALVAAYDEWATRHAHLLYRIEDGLLETIVRIIYQMRAP